MVSHPLTLKLIALLKDKAIGDVRMIKSNFGFAKPFERDHRLFANDLAGGGILDVGGYPVSMARLVAGIGEPHGIIEPDQVFAVGHLGSTGVDEWSAAVLRFPNGIIAEVSCSASNTQEEKTMRNALIVWGGWEGHEPQQCSTIVRDLLVKEGFDVMVEPTTSIFAS
ncbi:putative dehydrogenase [Rhizobium metallidurans]|uniref:Putative dehydrogenase n=1 Tax=Rhizobium metallidurans TaxID=1265931 RepID=A0A7W6G9H7_9HYPH|nr:putative dehydrogenase [Rhizobium metallidurans]